MTHAHTPLSFLNYILKMDKYSFSDYEGIFGVMSTNIDLYQT